MQNRIQGGIYLVIDPSIERTKLLAKLSTSLNTGIQAVQIWNNWIAAVDKLELIEAIGRLCWQYKTPLLINEDWQLVHQSEWLQGVHFDTPPDDLASIREKIAKPIICGITCSGDLDIVTWANDNKCDYVSFCAMFPSSSAGTCNIVMPATVRQARTLTHMPIFVSGGITPKNLLSLKQQLTFDGVAVISGILSADNPEQKIEQYKTALGIN